MRAKLAQVFDVVNNSGLWNSFYKRSTIQQSTGRSGCVLVSICLSKKERKSEKLKLNGN